MLKYMVILLLCFCSCGSNQNHSDLHGGSFSFDYGGSFSRLTETEFEMRDINTMTVNLVSKPVGLAIRHIFLAIRLNEKNIYMLGLIASDDLAFYEKNRNNQDFILKTLKIEGRDKIIASYNAIKEYLDQHPYRSRVLYGSALIVTPIAGRPCRNISQGLFEILSRFKR